MADDKGLVVNRSSNQRISELDVTLEYWAQSPFIHMGKVGTQEEEGQ